MQLIGPVGGQLAGDHHGFADERRSSVGSAVNVAHSSGWPADRDANSGNFRYRQRHDELGIRDALHRGPPAAYPA